MVQAFSFVLMLLLFRGHVHVAVRSLERWQRSSGAFRLSKQIVGRFHALWEARVERCVELCGEATVARGFVL